MTTTRNRDGSLMLGGLVLTKLALDPKAGTPSYVYDLDGIAAEVRALEAAFAGAPHLVAYAVKANSAGPVVRAIAAEGAGADVVSGAELWLALACGIAADRIVYSGVAKTDAEIDRAIGAGERGVLAIQLESVEEVARVEARAAALGRRARVSVRVNPAVDFDELATHAHIATGHDEAKFGIARDDVPEALARIGRAAHLDLVGFTVHVGSQFTSTDAYVAAARALFAIVRSARAGHGDKLAFVDTGGGFGVDYGEGCAAAPADFVRAARAEQTAAGLDGLSLIVEPGRSLVAAHGVLLARAIQAKRAHAKGGERRWLMIDAGMNDLIRPALYQAAHRIAPLELVGEGIVPWHVVGPVCESSDDFGVHAFAAEPPGAVAILDAGAYGYTMASRYNGRALPAEVFVRGGRVVALSERRPAEDWSKERAGIGTG
jgi:diaminopimelate decarboxylase